MKYNMMPPQPVNVAEVREEQWQPRVAAVRSVMAFQGIVVSTEAGGVVREIKFEADALAKTGDELAELDAEIEQAQPLCRAVALHPDRKAA
jgi:membrane fusion protein (multidrug efflux system)